MQTVSKLSIALTSELNAVVQQAIASDDYATGSEVIREALREWKQRRSLNEQDRADIVALWEAGLASGPGRFGSMDEIKAEARRRWADTKH